MAQLVKVRKVRIVGTGSYVPDRIVSNAELEQLVPTTDCWIRENLGISERRISEPGQCTSTLAIEAGKRALENSRTDPSEIDMILLATATPDRLIPATATKVQSGLGAFNAAAMDINAVCAGFIYGLTVGAQFVGTGASKKVLVIGSDTFSRITDWSRRDCVFFGDGAGAAVISASDDESGFMCMRLFADGRGYESFTVPAGGSETPTTPGTAESGLHFFRMDGRSVYKTAVEVIPAALQSVLKEAGISTSEIDHVVPHQPSIRILRESADRIGIPFSRFGTNMNNYANTSSGTIPILLDEMWRSGRIRRGDLVALVAVGAGWTWGAALLRW